MRRGVVEVYRGHEQLATAEGQAPVCQDSNEDTNVLILTCCFF